MSNANNNAAVTYEAAREMLGEAYQEVYKLRSQVSAAKAFFQGTPLEAVFVMLTEYTWAIRTDLEGIDYDIDKLKGK